MFQFRRIRLAGAVGVTALVALVGAGSGTASAQLPNTGCTALNNGDWNLSTTNVIVSDRGFKAGDKITIQVTVSAGSALAEFFLEDTGPVNTYGYFNPGAGGGTTTINYTVTGVGDLVLRAELNGYGSATVSTTATCTPANTNTNTDSQNIRSLQNSITPLVATTSGQAITNAIDGGINDGFSPNGTPTNFGPNGGFINFAAPEPKSQTASRADEAFAALGYADNPIKSPNFNKAPPPFDRQWSAWADIRGTGWKVDDTIANSTDVKGNQLNVTAGIGLRLTPDTLIGVVGGYENFKYDVASLAGSLKGDGETVGGYFAQRFGGNLRFDAAIAWSNVNYSATAGSASGSFTGSRWLASTGLTGTYKVKVYFIEPSAKVYALWESEKAWTDSLGTLQPSRNFSAGRTALGAKVGRSFEAANGWTLTPNAGLYGDWRFQSDSTLPTATPVANIGTGWSGRVTAGLSVTAKGACTVSFDGEYGGLGATYKIWTGNIRATVPF